MCVSSHLASERLSTCDLEGPLVIGSHVPALYANKQYVFNLNVMNLVFIGPQMRQEFGWKKKSIDTARVECFCGLSLTD